jgi:hypothetical protein
MNDVMNRRAVLELLSTKADSGAMKRLGSLDASAVCGLLRWLDQSGLALYFAKHVSDFMSLDRLPLTLRSELERRGVANRDRTKGMLTEFGRINLALRDSGIDYGVLKGFSMIPEFSQEPWLRHQTDVDILVSADAIETARIALGTLDYQVEGEEPSGELRLGISSGRPPSADDFLYEAQRHKQVEIHRSFYESVNGVSLQLDDSWKSHVTWKIVEGVEFPVLDLPHRALCQLLHAFRHILHGWLRMSWLFEIAHFIESHRSDSAVWRKVEQLMVGDPRVREACGVVLAMTTKAFGTELPDSVQRRWVAPLRKSHIFWVDNFGMEWMLADFPGNPLSLLLHREFADSRVAWRKYRLARSKRRFAAITLAKLANPVFLKQRIEEQLEYFWHYLHWNVQVSRHSMEREGTVPHNSQ